MRIAQIAPLTESVPPKLYGGTERVVSWLTDELVRRRHDVTLFASGDSRTAARLSAPYPRALRLDPSRPDPTALHILELTQAFERADDFDILHCHVDYLALPFARLTRRPSVHTLHGRLDLRHLARLLPHFHDAPLVSISDSQRLPLAQLGLNWVATVYHGLPVDRIPFEADARGHRYLMFLGRLSREKRPDLAVDVAKRLGLPLIVAGKIDPVDHEYFESTMRPLLDHPLIEFIGEVDDEQKWALLRDAICLLFPVDWPEPFGLVMIEAMACGTPIVARPMGAVPEIVEDGATGFLAESVEELVAAVKRVDTIDPRTCRAHAERRFSVTAMTDCYETVYARLIDATRTAPAR